MAFLVLLLLLLGGCAAPLPRRAPQAPSPPSEAAVPVVAPLPAPLPAPAAGLQPSTPTAKAPAEPELILVAVGDMRLDGPVGRLAAQEGSSAPTRAIRSFLEADIVFGNLECALSSRGTPLDKKFNFRASTEAVRILAASSFTIVSLANNHAMDYGAEGLEDTIAALGSAGILSVGAGPDGDAARAPVLIERNGLRVAFLALTSTLPEEIWAGTASYGVAFADAGRFPDWIRTAKSTSDIVVVSFHGGTELDGEPNAIQKDFVSSAFAAGADLILGHHPHVLQPVEVRGSTVTIPGANADPEGARDGGPAGQGAGVAVYSLGNFLFVSPTEGTQWTALARFKLRRGSISAGFLPLEIVAGRVIPAAASGREIVRAALDRYGALSAHPGRFTLLEPP